MSVQTSLESRLGRSEGFPGLRKKGGRLHLGFRVEGVGFRVKGLGSFDFQVCRRSSFTNSSPQASSLSLRTLLPDPSIGLLQA